MTNDKYTSTVCSFLGSIIYFDSIWNVGNNFAYIKKPNITEYATN